MAKIVCKQCNFENESERIYCHNCGTKLDRSLIPQDSKPEESIEKTRKRVMKLTKPQRGFFSGWVKLSLNTVLWALVAAGVIQAARPPDDVPPVPQKAGLEDVPPVAAQLDELNMQPAPQPVGIPEELANAYLRHAVKASTDGSLGDAVKFERVFVTFNEGDCLITAQQSSFGYPLYASVRYQLAIRDDKLVATNVGGSIGRLPVHPGIMQFSDVIFQKLWDALTRERKALDHMQSIEIHKGKILVMTKGRAPATPR